MTGVRAGSRAVLVYWISVPLIAAATVALWCSLSPYFIDLDVYRLGVYTWLSGGDLYGPLPLARADRFIYPPFAALLMVPLALLSWTAAWLLMVTASLAALVSTLLVFLRRLLPTAGMSGALVAGSVALPVCLRLEPVLQTFWFGQINLILMAMVAADCLWERTPWPRGLLVGLAAAVKLTPLAFLLYFLLRRQRGAAATAGVAALAATAVGTLVAPAASARYWTGGLAGAGGQAASPFFTNQTIAAVLTRAGLSGAERTVGWLLLSVGVAALVIPAIRRAPAPLALIATATLTLLISPVSWSHHWVWVAPAAVLAAVSAWHGRSVGWALTAALIAALTVVAPHRYLPHDDWRELSWSPAQQLVGASYVIAAAGLVVALWLRRHHLAETASAASAVGSTGS